MRVSPRPKDSMMEVSKPEKQLEPNSNTQSIFAMVNRRNSIDKSFSFNSAKFQDEALKSVLRRQSLGKTPSMKELQGEPMTQKKPLQRVGSKRKISKLSGMNYELLEQQEQPIEAHHSKSPMSSQSLSLSEESPEQEDNQRRMRLLRRKQSIRKR